MPRHISQEIVDLIVGQVAHGQLDDIRSCSLVSRSFRSPSQSHLFSTLLIYISRETYYGKAHDPVQVRQEYIDRFAKLPRFLAEHPRIRSYIKILRLDFDADLIVMNYPCLIPEILQAFPRGGIHTVELECSFETCRWKKFGEELKASLFRFFLENTNISCGGIRKVFMHDMEFPWDLFQFCPSVDEVILEDCRSRTRNRRYWPSGLQKEQFIHRPPPKIMTFSYVSQFEPFGCFLDGLYGRSMRTLLEGLEVLEYTLGCDHHQDYDIQRFWNLALSNANQLRSLVLKKYDCAWTRSGQDPFALSCNFPFDRNPINISQLPHLCSVYVSVTLLPVKIENPCTSLPYIFELFDPYPRNDSPISVETIEIVFEIWHMCGRSTTSIADTLTSHRQWGHLSTTLVGPRYLALRKVKVRLHITYINEEDCKCERDKMDLPFTGSHDQAAETLMSQFQELSSSPRIDFTFESITHVEKVRKSISEPMDVE